MPVQPEVIESFCKRCGKGYGGSLSNPVLYCRECLSVAARVEIQKAALAVDLSALRPLTIGDNADPGMVARVANIDAQIAALTPKVPEHKQTPMTPQTEFRRVACGVCSTKLGVFRVERPSDPSPAAFCDSDCESSYFAAGIADPEGSIRVYG